MNIFCHTLCKPLVGLIFSMLFFSTLVQAGENNNPWVKTIVIEGDYKEILSVVKESIKGKGVHIAHTLPAADVLHRTAKAYGISKPAYKEAEIVEFCSAKISHAMSQANPENIVLCPFAISVYVLPDNPSHVYLSTRLPFVIDQKSKAAIADMRQLINEIFTEVQDW